MFVLFWGGLVPPGFRVIHDSGLNPAAPICALALVGCWGALIAAVHPNFFHALRSRSAIIGALLGFAMVLLVKSSYVGPHDGVLLPTQDEAHMKPSAPRARITFPLLAVFLFFAVSTTDFYLKLSRENPPPPLPHEFLPTAPPR